MCVYVCVHAQPKLGKTSTQEYKENKWASTDAFVILCILIILCLQKTSSVKMLLQKY